MVNNLRKQLMQVNLQWTISHNKISCRKSRCVSIAIFLVPGKVWKWNERTFSRLLQLHWDLKWYSQPTATVCPQNYSLKAEPGFRNRSNFEPMCIFSLLYTVRKILSITYPYQYLFAPKTQKDMARKKIMKRQHHGTRYMRTISTIWATLPTDQMLCNTCLTPMKYQCSTSGGTLV